MDKFGIGIKDGSKTLNQYIIEQNSSTVQLYDWQREAINYFFDNNCRAIYQVVTGAGKTFFSIELIKKVLETDPKIMILIVVPKNVILEDTWFKELYDNGFSLKDIGVYYGKVKEFAKITITNMQSINDIPLELFDMAIFDECFVGDTKILIYENQKYIKKDIKYIVENKKKYYIPSFNIKKNKIENKKITNWFKLKEKKDILDIEIEDGSIISITKNQLIYTQKGYIKASLLQEGDEIYQWK